ncbi:MAG: GntR family transcriptional regulator [Streptosporangiaceae bacterium]
MQVDHDSSVPLYLQLAAILRRQIEAGELVSRVPSVRTLAQEYGVSHITAGKALSVLREEGLIESVRGKGAYVIRPRLVPHLPVPHKCNLSGPRWRLQPRRHWHTTRR